MVSATWLGLAASLSFQRRTAWVADKQSWQGVRVLQGKGEPGTFHLVQLNKSFVVLF